MNEQAVGVGIIGCGVISGAYLKAAQLFPQIAIKALADMVPAAAEARSREFGVPAMPVEALLASPDVEIVLNLTIPKAHAAVSLQALAAGKHVYLEKPLCVRCAEARPLLEAAGKRGLRIGCAPDTFLGGSHQTARRLLDEGAIGEPVAGTAILLLAGHERWHPSPDFYYAREGGGPMLDMGPYYITDLVNLLGPVAEVTAFGRIGRNPRRIAKGPRAGQQVPVECTTHVAGVMRFVGGAVVQIATSFEVWAHRHTPIELYGTTGSMLVPDPNRFDGEVHLFPAEGEWRSVPLSHGYGDDNYRSIGLADMAAAIRAGRPHRASGELAFHVLEVMEALVRSAEGGGVIAIESRCERPAPLAPSLAVGELT
jgi:predicted dehydrogenase